MPQRARDAEQQPQQPPLVGVIALTSTASKQPCWVPKQACEEASSESYQSVLVGIMCPFKAPRWGLLRALQG